MTLSHPSRSVGQGLITSNDSISTAMAKSSVIPPWPGVAHVLGKRCSPCSTEVLMPTPQPCKSAEAPRNRGVAGAPSSPRGENISALECACISLAPEKAKS